MRSAPSKDPPVPAVAAETSLADRPASSLPQDAADESWQADPRIEVRRDSQGAPLRVLLVGQGPPTRGGIPSFISMLLEDPWLQERVELHYLNTTPVGAKRPGALALANVTTALSQGLAVFRQARSADLVHLNLAPVPLLPLMRAGVLVWASRLARRRVILHSHTGRLPSAVGSWRYRALLRVIAAGTGQLIVVSKEAEAAASRCCRRVTLLRNAVDMREFAVADPSSSPVKALFVGTVCERKGLLDLRDALVALGNKRSLEVTIVGDGAQEGPGAWEGIVSAYAQSGLADVRFLGAVDRARVRELLQGSSIFCLPSHWEGGPLSVLEAMASGLAIIATRVGEVPEMLAEGSAGILIDVRDAGALAEALASLIEDPARRRELGRNARLRAESGYDSRDLVRTMYSIYVSAAGHTRARSTLRTA